MTKELAIIYRIGNIEFRVRPEMEQYFEHAFVNYLIPRVECYADQITNIKTGKIYKNRYGKTN